MELKSIVSQKIIFICPLLSAALITANRKGDSWGQLLFQMSCNVIFADNKLLTFQI